MIMLSPKTIQGKLAERNLRDFITLFWPILEPETPYLHNWHIDAICEHLEAIDNGQIKNLIINIPPRHMKSLLVSVFWPTWSWIHRPHQRWLFASYSGEFSVRDSIKCRRIIESPLYQELYGDRYRILPDQNRVTRFENDKTGFRMATSVAGAATGEGGDRVVVDDIMKAEDALSDVKRNRANQWWFNTMATRINNKRTGARVIIMQRLHEEDVVGAVLDKMEQGGAHYEHLMLPMFFEPSRKCVTCIGYEDPRKEYDELLWPEKYTETEARALSTELGPYAASAQLQQNPSPEGGGLFQDDWWRFWVPYGQGAAFPAVQTMIKNEVHVYTVAPAPPKYDIVLQTWDLTFKKGDTTDFVAGQVWGKKGADLYLLDQVHARLDVTGTIDAIRKLSAAWPEAQLKLIEESANGPAVIGILQKEIPGMTAIRVESSKEVRAAAAAPRVRSGNVYLPHPHLAPWVHNFIAEFSSFPYGKHDDQVDAYSQMVAEIITQEARRRPPRAKAMG